MLSAKDVGKAGAKARRPGQPPALVPGGAAARALLAAWEGRDEWCRLDSLRDLAVVVSHLAYRARVSGTIALTGAELIPGVEAWLVWAGMQRTGTEAKMPGGCPIHVWGPGDWQVEGCVTRRIQWLATPKAVVNRDGILVHGAIGSLGEVPVDVVLAAYRDHSDGAVIHNGRQPA